MKKLLLLFSFLLITNNLISCKKEKEEEPSTDDQELTVDITELLTAHFWLGVNVVHYVDGVEDSTTDITNEMYNFTTNGEYYYIVGSSTSNYGTWELIEGTPNELKLIDHNQLTTTYVIDKLTEDDLIIISEMNFGGTNDKFVITLKK